MKKFILDLYIIKKFLGTFFFIMILLMSIAVIFDVSEKIEDFVSRDAPLGAILFDYYLNFVVYYGNLFSSMIIFISVIFFTSKMAQNTEIVAIISSGVSFNRLLVPYFISATILAILSLYLNHQVLPRANLERLEFEELYIKNPFRISEENLHRELEPGTIIYFKNYISTKLEARHFSVEKWDGKDLKWKLTAKNAVFNPEDSTWQCNHYFIRDYGEKVDRLQEGTVLDLSLIHI